ncbi:MAG: response regulator [Planctomycetes bacterium]|nr:response regulator [Planctomycetota bacterium]
MAINVLIVDDSETVRAVLAKALRIGGIDVGEVHEAEHGAAALEILKDAWIDLVLADINMPVMDGEQMVLKMAEDGLLNTIPTIIVSTDGSRERAERLSAKGVRAFVRKPFTPESLRQAVHNVLGLE